MAARSEEPGGHARVPASLKVFLTALAIFDDLGAILAIALFYTERLATPSLVVAAFGGCVRTSAGLARKDTCLIS